MLDAFEQIPGVTSVGLIDNIHLNTLSTQNMSVSVDGVEPPPGREAHLVDQATIDPGFFEAAGVRLLRGRNFTQSDLPESPAVAIISEAMASRFWPNRPAVGQTIRRANDPDLLVVGVASDAKVRSLGEPPRSFVYRPYSQDYASYLWVVAKTTVDPQRTALDLLATGRELDADLWTWEAKTMDQHLGVVLLPARLSALLLSVFGTLDPSWVLWTPKKARECAGRCSWAHGSDDGSPRRSSRSRCGSVCGTIAALGRWLGSWT